MKNEQNNPDEFYTLPSAMNEVEELQDRFQILPSALNEIEIKIINKVKKPKVIDLPIEKPKEQTSKKPFNYKEFLLEVREQMHDLGLDRFELAQITYIPQQRIKGFLHSGVKLKEPEIKEIKKKLHISS